MAESITWPSITVVTPSYNQGEFIEETIKSVINQNYPNLEYIIIDGGSSDNSIEIIKKYEKYLTYWVSEPDKGQSDAINKGFARARGDYLTWVNSDDILLPGSLAAIAQELRNNPSLKWITGNAVFINDKSRVIHCSKSLPYNRLLAKMGLLVVGMSSSFFARSLYQNVEGLRCDLSFNMDHDLWRQFHSKNIYFYHIPKYLMAFRFHIKSKTSTAFFKERNIKAGADFCMPLFIKRKISSRQKEEARLLMQRYNIKAGTQLLASFLYRCLQAFNGNYLKAFYDFKKMQDRHWQEAVSAGYGFGGPQEKKRK